MKKSPFILLAVLLIAACVSTVPEVVTVIEPSKTDTEIARPLAKYEPPGEKILIFMGQDNESVGGNDRFVDGYVDHVGIPAGVTHYIALNSLNPDGTLPGLDAEADWNAGPMSLKYYLDSPNFKNAVVHLSISMVGVEAAVARGKHDAAINHLADFLKQYPDHPYLIRIGYEFDGSWNNYQPEPFKLAWKRVVDMLKQAGVHNFATVLGSSSPGISYESWENYYPGAEYVDWIGYSYFWTPPDTLELHALDFARDKHHPVMLAETAPRGQFLGEGQGEEVWSSFFAPLFKHMEQNQDVVKGLAYINCNWQSQVMWATNSLVWGDTRIQMDSTIHARWDAKMAEPRYVNADDAPYKLVGFTK